jgi:hypothetical protein
MGVSSLFFLAFFDFFSSFFVLGEKMVEREKKRKMVEDREADRGMTWFESQGSGATTTMSVVSLTFSLDRPQDSIDEPSACGYSDIRRLEGASRDRSLRPQG